MREILRFRLMVGLLISSAAYGQQGGISHPLVSVPFPTGGTQTRTVASQFADRLSVLDIAGVVCDGVTDIGAPLNNWISAQPSGSNIYLTVPRCSGVYYMSSVVQAASGGSLHIDILDGATLAGRGYFYPSREEIWRSNIHVSSSIASSFLKGQGQNLSDVSYVQNNVGQGAIGRSFTYRGAPVGPSGGDVADYHNATWNTGTSNIGLMGLWFVDVAPLNNAADISGGTNWGLESIEFNPINNGPDSYGWQPNAGVKPAWVGGPWVTPDCWAPDGCFGGSDEWAYAAVSQHSANHRWTSYPAIFSKANPSSLLTTDAIRITTPDGSGTVTFSAGGSLSAAATAISVAGIADVTATVDTFNRLVIYNSTGNAGKQIALADARGTPLTTLGIAAQTYVNTPHAPTGTPYIPGFYNGFAVLPGATTNSGYGFYAWGDGALPATYGLQIAGNDAGAYAPAGYGGNWLHGIDLINMIASDNNAALLQDSQCLAWFANPTTTADARLCDDTGMITTSSAFQARGNLQVSGGAGTLVIESPSAGNTIYMTAAAANTRLAISSNISDFHVSGSMSLLGKLVGTTMSLSGAGTLNSASIINNIAVNGIEYIGYIQGNGSAIQVKGDAGKATNLGATNSQVVTQGPLIDGTAVRVSLTGSGYIVPAYVDLVRFVQTNTIASQTVILPSALQDGQPVQFDNYAGEIAALTFSPSVQGWTNGSSFASNIGIRIRYDATDETWHREQ